MIIVHTCVLSEDDPSSTSGIGMSVSTVDGIHSTSVSNMLKQNKYLNKIGYLII